MPGTPDQSFATVIRPGLFQFCENGMDCAVLSAPARRKDRHESTATSATRAYAPRAEELRCITTSLVCRNCRPVGKRRDCGGFLCQLFTRGAGVAKAGTASTFE